MPLGKLRVELAKLVPAKHVIKLSFVKGNLRVTVWQESVKLVQKIMREKKFTEAFLNLLSTRYGMKMK